VTHPNGVVGWWWWWGVGDPLQHMHALTLAREVAPVHRQKRDKDDRPDAFASKVGVNAVGTSWAIGGEAGDAGNHRAQPHSQQAVEAHLLAQEQAP
jgi:hypothetical protein